MCGSPPARRRLRIHFLLFSQFTEAIDIDRQRYLTELSKLLGFMSARDRQAELERFTAMFDSAPSEEELIRTLGSPTKQAIAIARSYEPSDPEPEPEAEAENGPWPQLEDPSEPAPAACPAAPENESAGKQAAPEGERPDAPPVSGGESSDAPIVPDGEVHEAPASGEGAAPGGDAPVFGSDSALTPGEAEGLEQAERAGIAETVRAARAEAQPAPERAAASPKKPEAPAAVPEKGAPSPKRKAKPAALTIYIILSVIIGLPIAVVLIFIGVPFLALGVGLVAADVYALMALVPMLGMVSDILLVAGGGVILGAVGVLLAWLGLWLSLSLGGLWIGGVIFRLGSRLCFRKEEQ